MNFFKTLVNPTKTPKKETATPDVAKDQNQKETHPTTTTTTTASQVVDPPAPAAPKGMSIPPPPPPEPPRLESRGETAAKPVKTTPQEQPKDAAKEPQAAKGKSTKDGPFSKLFRPKTVEVEPQPVHVQVGASNASTLEAAAKPEAQPVQEKKEPGKASPFRSFFKPSKAMESKKEPSILPVPAEAAASQAVKANEEPKAPPTAPPTAKSTEVPVDNQSVSGTSQSGEDAANVPRKEKRNSIHLFFKNLGQKRHSDAGVQTEPVTSAPEKTK